MPYLSASTNSLTFTAIDVRSILVLLRTEFQNVSRNYEKDREQFLLDKQTFEEDRRSWEAEQQHLTQQLVDLVNQLSDAATQIMILS